MVKPVRDRGFRGGEHGRAPRPGSARQSAARSEITWGILAGLVVGKPVGIVFATALGVRLRLGRLPDGLSLHHVWGAGCVAGIGFTVSLFVADLAFGGALLSDAKVGIVAASLVSAALGGALLYTVRSRPSQSGGGAGDSESIT